MKFIWERSMGIFVVIHSLRNGEDQEFLIDHGNQPKQPGTRYLIASRVSQIIKSMIRITNQDHWLKYDPNRGSWRTLQKSNLYADCKSNC